VSPHARSAFDLRIAKALLARRQRLPVAGAHIGRPDQRDADAGRARGLDHRLGKLNPVCIRAPTAIVVQVVKLANRRHPRHGQLDKSEARDIEDLLGVEPLGQGEHQPSPAPEAGCRSAAPLGPPAQRALESV
jgi:hypothetical protein